MTNRNSGNRMVIVIARTTADPALLAGQPSPLDNACGAMGRSIAEKVRAGGGKARVPVRDIRIAIDTTDGVNALTDNFDLIDEQSQSPLLHALIRDSE